MKLYWFDEGDGYQHAHLSPKCADKDVADVLVGDPERTVISINLPPMTVEHAKAIAETLYSLAIEKLSPGPRGGIW